MKPRSRAIDDLPIYNFDVQEKGFPATANGCATKCSRPTRCSSLRPSTTWSVGAPLKK